jgi:hypothetical protein
VTVLGTCRSTSTISKIDTNRFSCSVSGDGKHSFRWGNRLLWTRPINHDIFSVSFMAFSSVLFCWIQNFTVKCHEVQLFQFVKLKIVQQLTLSATDSSRHFAKGSLVNNYF